MRIGSVPFAEQIVQHHHHEKDRERDDPKRNPAHDRHARRRTGCCRSGRLRTGRWRWRHRAGDGNARLEIRSPAVMRPERNCSRSDAAITGLFDESRKPPLQLVDLRTTRRRDQSKSAIDVYVPRKEVTTDLARRPLGPLDIRIAPRARAGNDRATACDTAQNDVSPRQPSRLRLLRHGRSFTRKAMLRSRATNRLRSQPRVLPAGSFSPQRSSPPVAGST